MRGVNPATALYTISWAILTPVIALPLSPKECEWFYADSPARIYLKSGKII